MSDKLKLTFNDIDVSTLNVDSKPSYLNTKRVNDINRNSIIHYIFHNGDVTVNYTEPNM
jgi:hypothetical protein